MLLETVPKNPGRHDVSISEHAACQIPRQRPCRRSGVASLGSPGQKAALAATSAFQPRSPTSAIGRKQGPFLPAGSSEGRAVWISNNRPQWQRAGHQDHGDGQSQEAIAQFQQRGARSFKCPACPTASAIDFAGNPGLLRSGFVHNDAELAREVGDTSDRPNEGQPTNCPGRAVPKPMWAGIKDLGRR